MAIRILLFTAIFLMPGLIVVAQPIINLSSDETGELGRHLSILEDPSRKLTIEEIKNHHDQFRLNQSKVPNFTSTLSSFWVRFELKNESGRNYFLLIDNPAIDKLDLYSVSANQIDHLQETGDKLPFHSRKIKRNNFIFRLELKQGESKTYYLRYSGTEGLELPLRIAVSEAIIERFFINDLVNGIYYGIMLVTILYNFFLFIMIKHRSYLYYILCIGFFVLLQAQLSGYALQFLWPDHPWFNNQGVFLFSGLSGIFAILFGQCFLKSKIQIPKLHRLGSIVILCWSLVITFSVFSQLLPEEFILINKYLASVSALLFSPYMLVMGIALYRQGFMPARFYLIAWAVVLVGVVIFVLKINGLLPHTPFTDNIMQIGSGLEAILLSLALGDKYNLLKKEKEATQKELNGELEKTNKKLLKINADLDNFVYTASHDLKAPISNIEGLIDTLKTDQCYMQEDLKNIIDMMETSVRKFKNTINDLSEITKVQQSTEEDIDVNNLYDVIDEIKILLKKQMEESNARITLDVDGCEFIKFSKKNFRSILYNLINNSIKYRSPERPPEIFIKARKHEGYCLLSVSDNGLGISIRHREKVFQMFKRAHDHVEGSGIGLYIIKRIIENEGGKIELESVEGKGSTFSIYFNA